VHPAVIQMEYQNEVPVESAAQTETSYPYCVALIKRSVIAVFKIPTLNATELLLKIPQHF
jgi:hypothetical protein